MHKSKTVKNRITALVLFAVMVLTAIPLSDAVAIGANAQTAAWDGTSAASFAAGDGTNGNPYQIATAAQLKRFADTVNGGQSGICAVLTANIVINEGNLSGYDGISENTWIAWTPIGSSIRKYSGTFDGAGYTISGLYFKNVSTEYVGLFGYIDTGATVTGVGVVNSYFKGQNYIGSVCAYNEGGLISSCYNTGSVFASGAYGGICGNSTAGEIRNCYNTGKVSGTNMGGGICGYAENNAVTNCYSTGAVSGTNMVGGICGRNYESSISNCYFLSGTAEKGIGSGSEGSATVLTADKMIADSSLANMSLPADAWYAPADNNTIQYFPQLKVFENNPNAPLPDNAIHISTADELKAFRDRVNAGEFAFNAVLTNDIVLNTGDLTGYDGISANSWEQWTPIGISTGREFKGTFDGQGHTVDGLYYDDTSKNTVGLFGIINSNAVIENVGVVNSYIKGDADIGGICGVNLGRILCSYNTGKISGASYTGGICGLNNNTVTNCYNTGTIEGTLLLGGISGVNMSSVSFCFNAGEIICESRAGGVSGNADGTVTNCYYLTGTADFGIGGETVGSDVAGSAMPLSLEDMTGVNALSTMGFSDTLWSAKEKDVGEPVIGETETTTLLTNYLPQLKVFGDTNSSVPSTISKMNIITDYKVFYLIYTAAQLKTFANIVNNSLTAEEIASGYTADSAANALLMADIVLNPGTFDEYGNYTAVSGETPEQWTPIGNNTYQYRGTFRGEGHDIHGLYCNNPTQSYVGLFGYNCAEIESVGVINSYVTGSYAGGICGYNTGFLMKCYNTGTVSGSDWVGGVCGYFTEGSILYCYNTGMVKCTGNYSGGVCGEASGEAILANCYNTGTVTGSENFGSVCGKYGELVFSVSCYYLENTCPDATNTNGTSKTAKQFGSGEVTYLLNGRVTDDTNRYFQKIGDDGLPVLYNARGQVYYSKVYGYSNSFQPSYFVTIPAKVTLGDTAEIKVYDVDIGEDKQVDVTLVTTALSLTNKNNTLINYTITDDANAPVSGTVLTAENQTDIRKNLHFSEPTAYRYSGSYSGTLTFTVSVENEVV